MLDCASDDHLRSPAGNNYYVDLSNKCDSYPWRTTCPSQRGARFSCGTKQTICEETYVATLAPHTAAAAATADGALHPNPLPPRFCRACAGHAFARFFPAVVFLRGGKGFRLLVKISAIFCFRNFPVFVFLLKVPVTWRG